MSLELYMHPLSSYCHKVLIALYENDTPFTPHLVDLGDEVSRAELLKLWPIGKFPVMRDDSRGLSIAESSIIIEYLSQTYPGATVLLPADQDHLREVRMRDRFFDLYVHDPMQKIVGDRLRPADAKDPNGVAQARQRLQLAYAMIDAEVGTWAVGDDFSMADCAAAPALFFADKVAPIGAVHGRTRAYLKRLMQRPSYARALAEAQPYMAMFPQ